MRQVIRPILATVLATCVLAPASAANLLVNGSFESGAFVNEGSNTMSLGVGSTVITGWTVTTDITAWIGSPNPWGLSATDGDFFLDLTNYQAGAPFAGVAQVITTVPGATYELSFDFGSSTFWGRPDGIMASAAGTSATFTSPPTGGNDDWSRESLHFVATSTSTAVLLQGVAGRDYIGLDNASVDLIRSPVAEPKTYALILAGLGLLGLTARRRNAP